MNVEFSLKSVQFRLEREGDWRELEALLDRVDKKGMSTLGAEELSRLPLLYRSSLSSLSVARSISLDQNVVNYLEGLSSRAYFCVYSTKKRFSDVFVEFFVLGFPRAVRKLRWTLLLSLLAMVCGGGVRVCDGSSFK